ncbi:MAG: glycerol-3-phosphate 1-O-acyltransferase PlsY [Spirochaetales bacterium]|nr:glycerol-3-phosphate 1-O-acyltransferase PlsY [Spirochaetales bacterium]
MTLTSLYYGVAAYLCGSLPTAYLLAKIVYRKNIYQLGSGNGGATNVYRLFGKGPGAVVFLLDFSKGFLPLLAARLWGRPEEELLLMCSAALLGHTFPVWTGFKGGKGVAVTAGTVSVLMPGVVPFCGGIFVLILFLSGYVSLSSLGAALTLPVYFFVVHSGERGWDFWVRGSFFLLLFLGVLFFHRANLSRLLRGEEKKITPFKQDREASSPKDGD